MTTLPRKYSGRWFTAAEVQQIRQLIADGPGKSRRELSLDVCRLLDWRKLNCELKELSCRVAMLRMHEQGLLELPAARHRNSNGRTTTGRTAAAEPQQPRTCSLTDLGDLRLTIVTSGDSSKLWNEYIDRYHYLGYCPLPGAQMRYFVTAGEEIVALFGYAAAAWHLAPRDRWIGWTDQQRQARLPFVVGQARFLILPWIQCKNLASKLLSLSVRQLPSDWLLRYGFTPLLLETFVQADKFRGTCYQAANWIHIGHTKGRGKKGRLHKASLPIKQIWLYPITKNTRSLLAGK